MKTRIIIKDKVYVPEDSIDPDYVRSKYTKRLYEQQICNKCEYLDDRHGYMCDGCAAYKGLVQLYKNKTVKGVSYVGLPIGDKRNFETVTGLDFKDCIIRDLRNVSPFDYKVKFVAQLREHQEKLKTEFLNYKYGLIEAPPRFGKSILSLSIALDLGQRTLFLASQHEFLTQFLDHLHGNEKEGIPKCTNLPELEKKYKKKLYGFPKTVQDYENFQFFVMTYQKFLNNRNSDKFKLLLKNVGTVIVDEVHQSAATGFAKVLSSFTSKYRLGVTATPERKDNLHSITKKILGPVVAKSTIESLNPTVYIHETGFKPKHSYGNSRGSWVYAMQALAKDDKRNELIATQIVKDVQAGHNVVVPVTFKKHALALKDLVNKKCKSNICEVFLGGGGAKGKDYRRDILSKVKNNKIKVLVGTRSLLQLGLNVPSWSAIYTIMPISNKPKYKQETSRIRTPKEGKKKPIIRLYVDKDLGQSLGCARNCLMHLKEFKYDFSTKPKQLSLVSDILSSGRSNYSEEGTDRIIKREPSFLDAFRSGKS